MIKIFVFSYFTFVNGQKGLMVPGSQRDEHNCVLDGGYSWCESTQRCQRNWETPCNDNLVQVDFCQRSNIQMCRMACDEPVCPSGQCAMRINNCCDYTCVDNSIDDSIDTTICSNICPPPPPCPLMPLINSNCHYVDAIVDHCGCTTGCPTIDCSSITPPLSGEGETCGGYMMNGMSNRCYDGLECVYTMGPMIADAPGTCQPICNTSRDDWGNCIDEGCDLWFDGCNTCDMREGSCTEKACYDKKEARCLDNHDNSIPMNCETWFDGCNTCSVNRGELQGCTMMYCFVNNEPYCQAFTTGTLNVGEICYRFCEDGSQNLIDRRNDCPEYTECNNNPSMISFDSCGNRAHTCNIVPSNGH